MINQNTGTLQAQSLHKSKNALLHFTKVSNVRSQASTSRRPASR